MSSTSLIWMLMALAPGSALLIGSPTRSAAMRCDTGRYRMQGAAPQIAKPKTVTRQVTKGPGGGEGGGKGPEAAAAKPKRKAHVEDVPLWQVLLLGDEEYVEDDVCDVLVSVIPEIDNLRVATQKYDEAQKHGKSLLLVVPKELGEAYVEQLIRAEKAMVYAEIVEEKN